MARSGDSVPLEEVLELARRLSPVDKVELISRLEGERKLGHGIHPNGPRRSLLGLLKDFGPAPSAEDIDAMRADAWHAFPRSDV
jgi:hypothetical protein